MYKCKTSLLGYINPANETLLQLSLFGDKDFLDSLNRHILELMINLTMKLVDWSEVL